VVDDEAVVLDTVRDGLTAHGYQVLKATSGEEALQVAQAHQGSIALALAPDLKVLFMSGFSTEVVVVHGLSAGDPLLVKPFSLDTLGRKVHEILDYRSPFSRPPQPPR
jgi:DNA-binding response OmpR family regulator